MDSRQYFFLLYKNSILAIETLLKHSSYMLYLILILYRFWNKINRKCALYAKKKKKNRSLKLVIYSCVSANVIWWCSVEHLYVCLPLVNFMARNVVNEILPLTCQVTISLQTPINSGKLIVHKEFQYNRMKTHCLSYRISYSSNFMTWLTHYLKLTQRQIFLFVHL